MRIAFPVAAILSLIEPAAAHDFWLQPQRFWIEVGASTPIAILVGHGANRAPWGVESNRVLLLRDIGQTGTVDHLSGIQRRRVAEIPAMSFTTPGTHIVAFQSTNAQSDLPAVRFNDYIKAEGLTPALRLREQAGTTNTSGREIYSRRAKALVQVGPSTEGQTQVTRPLGLTLEIVPERNPYAPGRSESFPVRVLYEGRALPGAFVKLTNLQADEKPVATQLTDRTGRATFRVPRTGLWQFNVVWTKPIKNEARGDFATTFSSLTFGFPPSAQRP